MNDDQSMSMSKGGGCVVGHPYESRSGVEREERSEAGVVDGAVVGGVSANETAAVDWAGENKGQLEKSDGVGAAVGGRGEVEVEREEETGTGIDVGTEETEETQVGAKTNAEEESKRKPPSLSWSAQVRNRSPTPLLLPSSLFGSWRRCCCCCWRR